MHNDDDSNHYDFDDSGNDDDSDDVAHSCAIFLFYLGGEI